MIYPKFLQAGGTIGVFAPSSGITDEEKRYIEDDIY